MKFFISSFISFLVSSSLFASQPSQQSEPQTATDWLIQVYEALKSPEYCTLLPKLVLSPNTDPDINVVLVDILNNKCNK